MDIDVNTLKNEYLQAVKAWPFLHDYENFAKLPYMTLFAVGSRETNLDPSYTQGKVGDGGHGHGVWQLDDRYHTIPAGFDTDVHLQAQKAAEMLVAAFNLWGAWLPAFAYYNSGQPRDWNTANHDYASDVTARLMTLQVAFPVVHGVRLLQLTQPYMSGADVQFFQHAWNLKHWKPTLAEDGVYGPACAQAVRTWQAQHGLTADGIVGPQTLATMAQTVV